MGLLTHAEYNLNRLGIRTRETGSQTVNGDELFSGSGIQEGSLNVVFGTNEDFSGLGSRSKAQNGTAASFINVAKDGRDDTITQFEVVQLLTSSGYTGGFFAYLENAVKDTWFTPYLNDALDGTPGQMKAANLLTLGGFSEMQENAEQYSASGP